MYILFQAFVLRTICEKFADINFITFRTEDIDLSFRVVYMSDLRIILYNRQVKIKDEVKGYTAWALKAPCIGSATVRPE